MREQKRDDKGVGKDKHSRGEKEVRTEGVKVR